MKKVLLLVLVFCSAGHVCKAESLHRPGIDWPTITIKFEIGKPFTCEFDWNVCKVTVDIDVLGTTAEILKPGDTQRGEPGLLAIKIPKDKFARYYPTFLNKLDGQNTVSFPSSYTFPEDVEKALGASRDIILQGNVPYPVRLENGLYIITVKY